MNPITRFAHAAAGAVVLLAAAIVALPDQAAAASVWTVDSGGRRVDGSGKVAEEARALTPFTAVVVTGPVEVRMKAADSERVVVRADDNIVPLIETRVDDGGRLVIGVKDGASFRTRNRMSAEVSFRELSSVLISGSGDLRADRVKASIFETTIRGSGDVVIESLDSDAVALSIAGSGDFTAAGRTAKLGVVIVGSGDVRAEKLEAREAAVRIRGSGDARVHAVESLQVDIAGSGDVRYRGQPVVTKKVAGSGEVTPLR